MNIPQLERWPIEKCPKGQNWDQCIIRLAKKDSKLLKTDRKLSYFS